MAHKRKDHRTKGQPGVPAYRWQALWMLVPLLAVTLAVFAPLRNYSFIDFDDQGYVEKNLNVTSGLTWSGIKWALTSGDEANWHPLTWMSHMLDVQLFGLNPGAHHAVNVLFHLLNTGLLFLVLYRMTSAPGRSAVAAALFAVHPLHVESVAWIAERKDVLSTFFWMLSLWAYVSYIQRPKPSRYAVLIVLFALGLMAKPMLVTLPFVLLLLDFWPLGRVKIEGRHSIGTVLRQFFPLIREKLPLMALTLISSVVTFAVQRQGGAVKMLEAVPGTTRIAHAMLSYFEYAGKMLWPAKLSIFYPYSAQSTGLWSVLAATGLIAVSLLAITAARHFPYIPVGWFWYAGTLVPVIGLVQVGGQSIADRYTYVPLIGLFLIAAWGIPDLSARLPKQKAALSIAAVSAILICAVLAHRQVLYWANSETLWEHALEVTENNYLAHSSLAQVQMEKASTFNDPRQSGELIHHFSEALRIAPGYPIAHNNFGLTLARMGRLDEAVAQYREALRLDPRYAQAHNNLALALGDQGKAEEAIAQFSEALALKPDYAEAHNNFGIRLTRMGKLDEAINQFSQAIQLNANVASTHNNLANALLMAEKVDQALLEYSKALQLDPGSTDARFNLGSALLKQGKTDAAIHEFSEVLRLAPQHPYARQMLDKLTESNSP